MSIEARNLIKSFGSFKALRDVSLLVPTGQLVALLGPSGSGKTTLLRIIAGLEQPDSGTVLFHGEDVHHQPIGTRGVGFVFQHYALFRHMSVFENVAFGLRVRPRKIRPSDADIRERVLALLDLVQLKGLAQRSPTQLSGGQRQRVALARALAVEPKILLLDEPFGALDAKVRRELRTWLRRLHERLHVTSVFVTHDQDEALEVADQVVVMNNGAIEQVGAPDKVFHEPATEFVMDFLGHVNHFHGRVDQGKVRFADVELDAPEDLATGSARVFVRPYDLELAELGPGDVPDGEPGDEQALGPDGEPDAPGSFVATVRRIHAAGPTAQVELESRSGEEFVVHMPLERLRELSVEPNRTFMVRPRNVRIFADGAGI